jgi:YVTN family beta-propeller protein
MISIKIDESGFRAGRKPRSVREDAMNLRIPGLLAIAGFALAGLLGNTQSRAQNAYITNSGSSTVSVIDTATNKVIATIPVGKSPGGVVVSPDGSKVYAANNGSNSVSVIATATNTVIATIRVLANPLGVAVSPDGSKVYVALNCGRSQLDALDAPDGWGAAAA